jgi:hypothetical protein
MSIDVRWLTTISLVICGMNACAAQRTQDPAFSAARFVEVLRTENVDISDKVDATAIEIGRRLGDGAPKDEIEIATVVLLRASGLVQPAVISSRPVLERAVWLLQNTGDSHSLYMTSVSPILQEQAMQELASTIESPSSLSVHSAVLALGSYGPAAKKHSSLLRRLVLDIEQFAPSVWQHQSTRVDKWRKSDSERAERPTLGRRVRRAAAQSWATIEDGDSVVSACESASIDIRLDVAIGLCKWVIAGADRPDWVPDDKSVTEMSFFLVGVADEAPGPLDCAFARGMGALSVKAGVRTDAARVVLEHSIPKLEASFRSSAQVLLNSLLQR